MMIHVLVRRQKFLRSVHQGSGSFSIAFEDLSTILQSDLEKIENAKHLSRN